MKSRTIAMTKKRRSKTLEKAARAVKDSDEFVEHIFSIARGFAEHHELDSGAGSRGVRRSLAVFEKNATHLVDWLEAATERGTAEHEALNEISAQFQALGMPYIDGSATRSWLQHAVRASKKADKQLQGKKLRNAPRFAADALRSTFEYHRLKVAYQASDEKQSDAVKLLCAIAKDGGDPTMTPALAREWLMGTKQHQAS
jgi:hypothetical protein